MYSPGIVSVLVLRWIDNDIDLCRDGIKHASIGVIGGWFVMLLLLGYECQFAYLRSIYQWNVRFDCENV